MGKKKTYLLDTNVLMRYPNAIYGFDDNNVVITAITTEELDRKNNGIVFASETMLGDTGTAQIYFEDKEVRRSRLAEAASERMPYYFS